MTTADERVFGPADGPQQGRWDSGPLITCPDCGVTWHGTGQEKCWSCPDEQAGGTA